MKYLFIVLIIIVSIVLVLSLLNNYLSKWFCTHFGHWHLQPKQFGFDGCSQFGICPRCGKKVLQDGQGNWF